MVPDLRSLQCAGEQTRASRRVGVNVRRMKYVINQVYKSVIQALPIGYYERALEEGSHGTGPQY